MRTPICLIAALVVAAALPAAAGDAADVLVRVDGEPITRGERDAVVSRAGAAPGPALEAAVIEQLVDQRLLLAELARRHAIPAAEEVDEAIAALEARGKEDPGFASTWKAMQADPERLRRQLELELAITKTVQPQVTRAALDEHFAQHHREFDGTRLRISHILLRPLSGNIDAEEQELRRRAEEIRLAVVQGDVTFEEAARMHSDGPSRRQGGDLGWIGRHEPCAEDFSTQVFPLAKGNVSPPFISSSGVHVVTVTDVQPGRLGLEDVAPAVQAHFAATTVRKMIRALREEATVEWLPGVPHFDPAESPDGGRRRVIVGGATEVP